MLAGGIRLRGGEPQAVREHDALVHRVLRGAPPRARLGRASTQAPDREAQAGAAYYLLLTTYY